MIFNQWLTNILTKVVIYKSNNNTFAQMRGYCQKFQLWNPLQWAIYINNSVDKKKLPVSCYTPPLIQDHCFLRSLPLLTIILISIIIIAIIIRVNRIREMVSFELGKELEKDVYMGQRKIGASERGIQRSEVWFLVGTPNFFFLPHSWQDKKHLSLVIRVISYTWLN